MADEPTRQTTTAAEAKTWALDGGGVLEASFPGGNILVDSQDGDLIRVRQDRRDTEGWWFWWCFRVRGAAGRRLTFEFTDGAVLGTRGAACSRDGGRTWSWLAATSGTQFTAALAAGDDEARFAFAMPYQQSDFERFLERQPRDRPCRRGELCRSEKGRGVECLEAGRLDGRAPACLLLTARHHACEAVANLVMEGLLEAILEETGDGAWFRDHVEVLAVPFVDKDGVEDGDQGKNRRPRDHNRDYSDPSLYASVRALRARVPAWSHGRPLAALDLHCPHIRGAFNEQAYFVGQDNPRQWQQTTRLSQLLEQGRRSPVPYAATDNLAFGQAWNTGTNWTAGSNFSRWAQGLPGACFGGSLEFPYANVRSWTVEPAGVRAFGHDLARAFRLYLAEALGEAAAPTPPPR